MMNYYYNYIRNIRKKYLNYFNMSSKVLDIGCGDGVLMKYLQEEGYSVYGIDTDLQAVTHCVKNNLSVFQKDAISFLQKNKNSFGSIICCHVIEHIPINQIAQFIECCYNTLLNNGILLIITPNVHTLEGTANFWNDPSHIRPYTIPCLEKLLTKAGFEIIEIGYDKNTKIIIRNDLIHFVLDAFRIILGFLCYGKPALYTEINVLARKKDT